jgi:hypothetical protein
MSESEIEVLRHRCKTLYRGTSLRCALRLELVYSLWEDNSESEMETNEPVI